MLLVRDALLHAVVPLDNSQSPSSTITGLSTPTHHPVWLQKRDEDNSGSWSTIQIVVPIIIGVALIFIFILLFLLWGYRDTIRSPTTWRTNNGASDNGPRPKFSLKHGRSCMRFYYRTKKVQSHRPGAFFNLDHGTGPADSTSSFAVTHSRSGSEPVRMSSPSHSRNVSHGHLPQLSIPPSERGPFPGKRIWQDTLSTWLPRMPWQAKRVKVKSTIRRRGFDVDGFNAATPIASASGHFPSGRQDLEEMDDSDEEDGKGPRREEDEEHESLIRSSDTGTANGSVMLISQEPGRNFSMSSHATSGHKPSYPSALREASSHQHQESRSRNSLSGPPVSSYPESYYSLPTPTSTSIATPHEGRREEKRGAGHDEKRGAPSHNEQRASPRLHQIPPHAHQSSSPHQTPLHAHQTSSPHTHQTSSSPRSNHQKLGGSPANLNAPSSSQPSSSPDLRYTKLTPNRPPNSGNASPSALGSSPDLRHTKPTPNRPPNSDALSRPPPPGSRLPPEDSSSSAHLRYTRLTPNRREPTPPPGNNNYVPTPHSLSPNPFPLHSLNPPPPPPSLSQRGQLTSIPRDQFASISNSSTPRQTPPLHSIQTSPVPPPPPSSFYTSHAHIHASPATSSPATYSTASAGIDPSILSLYGGAGKSSVGQHSAQSYESEIVDDEIIRARLRRGETFESHGQPVESPLRYS